MAGNTYEPNTSYASGQNPRSNKLYAQNIETNNMQKWLGDDFYNQSLEGLGQTGGDSVGQSVSDVNASGLAGKASGALGAAGVAYNLGSSINDTIDFNAVDYVGKASYNPYYMPPEYNQAEVPEHLRKGSGFRNFTNNAPQAFQSGMALGGPWGGVAALGATAFGSAIQGALAGRERGQIEDANEAELARHNQASESYYNNLASQSQSRSQAQSIAKRGENIIPYYNSQIYGFV